VKNYFPPSFGKPTSDGMDEEWAVNYRQSWLCGKFTVEVAANPVSRELQFPDGGKVPFTQ
jgi:hypothetical protein